MRHGGRMLIEQLEAQGVTTAFTVPGESFLAALDGLHESNRIRTIICRQEGGASMMAEAWGKLTGEPGICFVTRGPGVANAMSGLHIAQQDSSPMILFAGLPGRDHEDREAFQEIETKSLLGTFVKWVAVIRETGRIPEYVSRAFHVARSGRPGPVVLGLPEDMLSAAADAGLNRPARIPDPAPSQAEMDELAALIAKVRRPLMIVGGPGWSPEVAADVTRFAERFDMPVATAFRCQDYIDNRHANFVGTVGIAVDPKLAAAVKDADLLLVVGARLGEMTTSGYTLLDIPSPAQKLVHVHPSPDELGTVYRAELPMAVSARAFARALAALTPPREIPWGQRRADLRSACEAFWRPLPTPGAVGLEQVIAHLSRALPDDAIVTNGAGNYAAFLHRYFQYKRYRTQLAPTSGSMGYGLPAAIAAKLADPHRTVVALAGDGCFMMTCQELATAAQYGLAIVTIVVNNSSYGTIRMHQERSYPERVIGTTLVNPDFAAFARAFGGHGETVTETAQFPAALERAIASGRPAVIEVRTEAEAITPRMTLSQIRAAGG